VLLVDCCIVIGTADYDLGHFATAISTLLRRYVVDIATNLESPKHHFM
jgi:hypothetical protein